MSQSTSVQTAIDTVRRAVRVVGKKPLADRAGLTDTNLRDVDKLDWNPTAGTLLALELAAHAVLDSGEAGALQRDSAA